MTMTDHLLTAALIGAAFFSAICIVRGMLLIQRAGAGDTLQCSAVVRQVQKEGLFACRALLTLTAGESVLHVSCCIPGQWFRRLRVRPTDVLNVLWRRGETEAVALRTIRHCQTLLILGVATAVLLVLLAARIF